MVKIYDDKVQNRPGFPDGGPRVLNINLSMDMKQRLAILMFYIIS